MLISDSLRGISLVSQDIYQSMPMGYERAAVHIALNLPFKGLRGEQVHSFGE